MRLDGWKYMQSVTLAYSMLNLELQTSIVPPLAGNDKRHKMNSNNNKLKHPIYQLRTLQECLTEQLRYIQAKYNLSDKL